MTIKNLFWYSFYTFLFWCLLFTGYYFVSGFSQSAVGWLFTAAAIPAQSAMFAAVLFLLCLLFRVVGTRTALAAAFVIGWGASLFFLLDVFVYSQYRFHVNLAMMELFFGPAGREIFVFPGTTYVMAALVVLLTGAITWGLIKAAQKTRKGRWWILLALAGVLACEMGYHGLHAWGKFFFEPTIMNQVSYLPMANPLSANRRLRKMGYQPKAEPLSAPTQGQLNYPKNPLQCQPKQTYNFLVILVDSWRADAFSPKVTPHIYRYFMDAKDGFWFTNHLSGGNATESGVFSLFYSMPYSYWNAATSAHVEPALLSQLREKGYQFGIFASSRLDSPAFNQNVFAQMQNLRIQSRGVEKYERDEDAQKDFLNFLSARDPKKPFFGFLFYDSAHGLSLPPNYPRPFKPAKTGMNYLLLTKNTDPAPYMNAYKNSIHYIDSLLGAVFKDLQARGLDKNTIVVITGDHGQEINDTRNNFWGHNSNFADYQTRVPLLIRWPGKTGQKAVWRTAHYDVIPTLMQDALNCANPTADYSTGHNLFSQTPRPYTLLMSYTKKAIRDEENICVMDSYGALEHYDAQYKPTDQHPDAKEWTDAFKQLSQFYK